MKIITTKYVDVFDDWGLDKGCVFSEKEINGFIREADESLVACVNFHSSLGWIKDFYLLEDEWGVLE